MQINNYTTILVLLITIFIFSCGNPEKIVIEKIPQKVLKPSISPSVKRKLHKKLNKYFLDQEKYHGFNGSVIISKRKEIIFEGNYGVANFSNKSKLDSSYSFQLASLSKQFTAAAIVLLEQEGKLNFDDTITMYYPNFFYHKATIRQCLNHTAGLPKYFWIAEHKWEHEYAPTNQQMMELLEDDDVNPFFSPGRKYAYSNTAYMVLAALVEKISGESYANFLKENIFAPIGMTHSYAYSYSYDDVREKQLWGYRRSGRRYIKIPGTVNDAIVGDKNVYSTAHDMFKWYKVLNSDKLISDTNRRLMYTLGKTTKGYEIPYGFGFHIDADNNIIYHNGKWNGFRNTFRQYPDEDVFMVVLEHTSYRGFSAFIKRVKNIVNEFEY